ncbi:MAG TPA: methyltransferase domain-containing protein, partial [Polyangiales bacterium]
MTLNTMLTRVKNVTARSYRRNPLVREFKRLNDALERMQRPKQRRTCPICLACFEEYVPFRNRQKARCPSCGSFERHRLSWLYLTRETRLLHEPTRFLHFAPEEILRARIASNFNVTYTPASYDPSLPEPGIDIQALPFADATFDLVTCRLAAHHFHDAASAFREVA